MRKSLILPKSFISLLTIVLFEVIQLEAMAKTKIYTYCQMGDCYDTYFISKEIFQRKQQGIMYLLKLETHVYPAASNPSNAKKRYDEVYIFCSKQKPAHIIPNWGDSGEAIIDFLNPGGTVSHASAPRYSEYWATCHNLIDTYFQDLTDKAIQLGYPLNLKESQIQSNDPFQFFN